MFAKLDKLRADHEKALKKLEEAQLKVDETAARVKEGEATEILTMITEKMKWTPEQLADFISKQEADKKSVSSSAFNYVPEKKNDQKKESEGSTNGIY